MENQIKSSLGILNKKAIQDRVDYDFITYHRKEIDWLAFLVITILANLVIYRKNIKINEKREEMGLDSKSGQLKNSMNLLLGLHILQFLFLRHFYTDDRKVNTGYKWVWMIHLIVYPYVIWRYMQAKDDDEESASRRVWIPMDITITVSVAIYYFIHLYS